MRIFELLLLPAFVVALMLWSALAVYVVAARIVYDLRRRRIQLARRVLAQARSQAIALEERARRLGPILKGLPGRTIRRVASDASTPAWMAQAVSMYALERWGVERLVREASAHRGPFGKWRRVAALRMLHHAQYPGILPLLEEAVRTGDRDVGGVAVDMLGKMADVRAAQVLVDALRAQSYPASRIATQLDDFPLPVPELLQPLLRDLEPVARFWGATLLSRYSATDEIEAELTALGDDPDPRVRKAAVVTLGKLAAPSAVDVAIKLLDDPVWWVKAHAARTLGHLGRVDLAPQVAPLLADSEWWVRTAAKESLEAMGKGVWEDLVPYLDHPDRFARNGAAEVLQNMGVVDSLVEEAASNESGGAHDELLCKVLAAGEGGLVAAAVERAEPRAAPQLRRLLEKHGLEPAGRLS